MFTVENNDLCLCGDFIFVSRYGLVVHVRYQTLWGNPVVDTMASCMLVEFKWKWIKMRQMKHSTAQI